LPSGAIRAAVSVHNNMSHAGSAILYGPALRLVTHEYPLLSTRFVIDRASGAQTTYIGFLVPRIKADGTAHLLLRFKRPTQPRTVFVTDGPHVNGRAVSQRNLGFAVERIGFSGAWLFVGILPAAALAGTFFMRGEESYSPAA